MYLYINGAAIARCGLVLTRAGSSHGMAGTMTIALTPVHTTHIIVSIHLTGSSKPQHTAVIIPQPQACRFCCNRSCMARHTPTHTPEPIPTTGTVTCTGGTIKLVPQKCGHEIIR